MIRRRIIRAVLLCAILGAGWYFYVRLWPSFGAEAIYKATSLARLQLLAKQAVPIADGIGGSNSLTFSRGKFDIPAWTKDLEPCQIYIDHNQVRIDLCSRLVPLGFHLVRSEDNSNRWWIGRYHDSFQVDMGYYQSGASAMDSVEPTSASISISSSQFRRASIEQRKKRGEASLGGL